MGTGPVLAGWFRLVRQFDPVEVFLVALVLLRKDLFEPVYLFLSEPLIRDRGMVTDDKLLAATVTSERSHFLTESVLYNFIGGHDGGAPWAGLIFDVSGNLYGTTFGGGDHSCGGNPGCGVVFKLAPNSNGGWKETVLHPFVNHPGAHPTAGVILDQAGNLFGTTVGYSAFGSVFEITP